MSIKGFDGYHGQVSLDPVAALADGYEFFFWKVSEDNNFADPTWAKVDLDATNAGLQHGGYHLGRDTSSAQSQWNFYAARCPNGPAVLDIEAGPAMSDARSDAWVASALAAGRQVVVYGIYAEIKRHRQAGVTLWATNLQPTGDAEFTQDGSISPKWIGNVPADLDHFHGTTDELAAIFGGGTMGSADDYFDQVVKLGITGVGDFAGNQNYLTGFRYGRRGVTGSADQVKNPDFKKGYDDGVAWVPAGGSVALGKDIPAVINPS